jgi:hypothetical protein
MLSSASARKNYFAAEDVQDRFGRRVISILFLGGCTSFGRSSSTFMTILWLLGWWRRPINGGGQVPGATCGPVGDLSLWTQRIYRRKAARFSRPPRGDKKASGLGTHKSRPRPELQVRPAGGETKPGRLVSQPPRLACRVSQRREALVRRSWLCPAPAVIPACVN